MKKILLNLLFVVLTIPWITQAQAQCDTDDMCAITISARDSYCDGWNGNMLSIYQFNVLVGQVTLTSGCTLDTMFVVCPDSIRLEWTVGSYPGECSFEVYDIAGGILYDSPSGMNGYSGVLTTVNVTCPSCFVPLQFTEIGNTPSSVSLRWTNPNTTTSAIQVAYGPIGFNPDASGVLLSNITADSVVITDLSPDTTYHFYVRADCDEEQSTWVGPLTIRPGVYVMANTGTDTISTCGVTIVDDGGITGNYSGYASSTLVVYPSSPDMIISLSGSIVSESYDYLMIYEGTTADPNALIGTYYNCAIPTIYSQSGPLTIYFKSDYSGNYAGYELNVQCVEAPSCYRLTELNKASLSNNSITISWVDTAYTYSYELEYDTAGFEVGTGTVISGIADTVYEIINLLSNTEYDVYVRVVCPGGGYSLYRSLRLRTACDPMPADSIPYIVTFNNATAIDPCWKAIANSSSNIPNIQNSALHMKNSTPGTYALVALPLFGVPVTDLALNFNLYCDNTGDVIDVGVMADPSDHATFTKVASYNLRRPNQWENFTTYLSTYHGSGNFIAFRIDGNISYSEFYIDSIVVDYQPTCSNPENLEIASVGPTSAIATWEPNIVGTTTQYEVEISVLGTNTWIPQTPTTNLLYTFSGLSVGTDYAVRVRSMCGENNYSVWSTTTFSTRPCISAGVVDATIPPVSVYVGDSASASTMSNLPTDAYYSYSYTQQLFLVEELGNLGNITSLTFEYAPDDTVNRNITIYLATTDRTNMSSGFVGGLNFTQVFTGVVTFRNGVNTIQFNTPYSYGANGNLLLVVTDNTGDWVSGKTFKTTSTTDVMSVRTAQDSRPYSTANPPSDYAYNVNYRNCVRFYGYPCNTNAANVCLPPLVATTDVQSDQASITWAPGNTETSWTVDYRLADDTVWTVASSAVTVNNITIYDLMQNSNYVIRVTAECGSETASATVSITTPCGKIDELPFVEDFNSSNSRPSCWNYMSTYASHYPSISTYYDYLGAGNSIEMYCYASNAEAELKYTVLASPQIETMVLPMNTLQTSFYLYRQSDDYPLSGVIVGVMSDPSDMNTFVPVDTAIVYSSGAWEGFEVSFADYSGEGEYIAFVSRNIGSADNQVFLDNIIIDIAPSCPRVRNVVVSNITENTATVSWTSIGADEYVVEYGNYGFELGTGTLLVTTADSLVITGLNASRYYDVYVRAICPGNDSSLYSFVSTFITPCGDITTLPFAENFNNWGNTGLEIPYCWSRSVEDYPYFSTRDRDSLATGRSLYFNYSTNTNNPSSVQTVSLPALSDQIAVNTLKVSFDIIEPFVSESYDCGIIVGIADDPDNVDSTFTPIDTIMASSNYWTSHEVSLESYIGTGRYITFKTYSVLYMGSYEYPDLNIDNVVVDLLPNCRRTTNLAATNMTATTVDLAWNGGANTTSWVIEYGPEGFQLGTGTQVVANTNPYTLTGLSVATTYEYNVRGVCSATDSGDYALENCRFTTLQIPATLPYTYNFETETEWTNWQTTSNQITNWYRGNAVAGEDTYSMYVSSDTGATNSSNFYQSVNATAYRDIDFGSTSSSFVLSFKAKVGRTDSPDTNDGLAVFIADPYVHVESSNVMHYTPWGSVTEVDNLLGIYAFGDSNWHDIVLPVDNVSGVQRLVFYWFNRQSGYYNTYLCTPAAIDNIVIEEATCIRPTNLSALPTTTSADLTWDGTADGYIVSYKAVADSAVQNVYTNTNSYTLIGLVQGATVYEWSVRSICGTDTSIYSTTEVFQTECFDDVISTFPFVEEFESSVRCWEQNYILDSIDWQYATSIMVDADIEREESAYSGNGFAMFITDERDGYTTRLVSPIFNLTVLADPYLRFAHIHPAWGSDLDTLGVYYRVHQDSAWTYLSSYNYTTSSWDVDSVALPNASANYQLSFVASSFWGFGVGIDNIVVNGTSLVCAMSPIVVDVIENTANISWTEAGEYELKYRKSTETEFSDVVALTNTTGYMLTALYPNTEYVCAVRRYCSEAIGYSEWVEVTFTTDAIPCEIPTEVAAGDITYTSATISWTSQTEPESWEVRYMTGSRDTTIVVDTTVVVLENLYSGDEYQVWVRAFCGMGTYSDWSEVYTFSTVACEVPSNVTASDINPDAATISWTSTAQRWEISYGFEGVNEENGIIVDVEGTPSYTIEGLEHGTTYDVYVRAICEEGVYSAWSSRTQFTTPIIGINTASNDNVDVRIYPNPANTQATVTVEGISGKVEFVVADMNGRMMMTETITCEGSLVKTIDVSNLAKGAYFVHIYNDSFNTTRKLIVK